MVAPPRPTMARRRKANRPAYAERLIATPSMVPAAGGIVRLRARVRRGLRCRFSSRRALRRLPSTRHCSSGRAFVLVRVPRNRSRKPRSFVVYLTVSGPRGRDRTVRDVIHQRSRRHSRPGALSFPGETAASGVQGAGLGSTSTAAGPGAAAVLGGSGQPASGIVPPVVTAQPTAQSVTAGAPVSFSAAASGSPAPSARWQVSTDGGASWADGSPSFVASASQNGDEYRAVFSNQAGSATTVAVTLTVLAESTTNFSGYIDYAQPGQAFTAVSANWVVPSVTCQPGATSWAAQWPGIGDGSSVEQDGTETDCFGGSPSYWAWYEMFGDPAVSGGYAVPLSTATYPVLPGDEMTGSVTLTGSTWVLALSDSTQHWNFQIAIASPSPQLSQDSAEWMVEDPNGCSPCQPLAQFSPVQFSAASATVNGQTGSISSFPSVAMAIDQGSTLLSAPGSLDAAGDGFTDTRLAG